MEISKYEEENILGDDGSGPTLWKLHKSFIESRPKGWLRRFANKVDDAELVDRPKSYLERKEERMRASGWVPIRKKFPVAPDRFDDDRLSDIKSAYLPSQYTNHCYLCWGLVPRGPARVECIKCPVVSHNACVIDVHRFKLPVLPSSKVNSVVQQEVQSEAIQHNSSGVVCNWVCPLCIQAVQLRNNSSEISYQAERRRYEEEYAAMKIQSFARLVRPRAEYNRVLIGIITLQRVVRARRYWRKAEGDRASALLRPFRMRIHSVCVFVNTQGEPVEVNRDMLADDTDLDPASLNLDDSSLSPAMKRQLLLRRLMMAYNQVIGEITANNYSEIQRQEHAASAQSTSVPSTADSQAKDDVMLSGRSVGEQEVLSLLRVGHLDCPAYIQPFRMSHGRTVSKGTYFLTVAVQPTRRNDDYNYEEPRQLYRVDSPMKMESSPAKITPQLLKKMGIELQDTSILDGLANIRVVKFSLPRSYILFPGSETNVVVKLTVSQAYTTAETIKSALIGSVDCNINSYMIWRRNLSASSSLSGSCTADDLPMLEEGCRVDIHMKRPLGLGLSAVSQAAADSGEGKGAARSKKESKLTQSKQTIEQPASRQKLSEEETIGYPLGGVVTWSLLTVSYDHNDQAGEAFMLLQPFIQSSRRRQWITLLDRVLSVFPSAHDLVPSLVLDLRLAHVAPLDSGIIRLKYRLDNWYLFFQRPADGLEWMRKLYSQSLSAEFKKYSDAMLLPKHKFVSAAVSSAASVGSAGSGAGVGNTSASRQQANQNPNVISWEDYLGDLCSKIRSGMGTEDGSNLCSSMEALDVLSARNTGRSASTSRPGTSSKSLTKPASKVSPTLSAGDYAPGSHTPTRSAKTSGSGSVGRPSLASLFDESEGGSSNSTPAKMQPRLPAIGAPPLPQLTLPAAGAATPTPGRRNVKSLTKRENTLLGIFAQAARRFPNGKKTISA